MRSTVLGENDVGAIIHERLLKVGGEQSMVFNDINSPPISPLMHRRMMLPRKVKLFGN